MMIGAKAAVHGEKDLSFRFPMCKKANVCRIEYDEGMDLYNMTFSKMRKYEVKEVETFPMLYAEDLKITFEGFTGLDTRLPFGR